MGMQLPDTVVLRQGIEWCNPGYPVTHPAPAEQWPLLRELADVMPDLRAIGQVGAFTEQAEHLRPEHQAKRETGQGDDDKRDVGRDDGFCCCHSSHEQYGADDDYHGNQPEDVGCRAAEREVSQSDDQPEQSPATPHVPSGQLDAEYENADEGDERQQG